MIKKNINNNFTKWRCNWREKLLTKKEWNLMNRKMYLFLFIILLLCLSFMYFESKVFPTCNKTIYKCNCMWTNDWWSLMFKIKMKTICAFPMYGFFYAQLHRENHSKMYVIICFSKWLWLSCLIVCIKVHLFSLFSKLKFSHILIVFHTNAILMWKFPFPSPIA